MTDKFTTYQGTVLMASPSPEGDGIVLSGTAPESKGAAWFDLWLTNSDRDELVRILFGRGRPHTEATAYIVHRFECPGCGYDNEQSAPYESVAECVACRARVTVST